MAVTTEVAILSSIVASGISLALGKFWGAHGKTTEEKCAERRLSCTAMNKVTCADYDRRLAEIEHDIKMMCVEFVKITTFIKNQNQKED